MKEINNFSDISFKFEETKIGRKVTGIKFIIKQNQNNKARNEIAATSAVLREEIGIQPQKNIDNIKLVKAIISEDIKDLEAIKIFNIASVDINIIKEKYNIVRQLNNVKNLVGTVITAIKEDWSFPKGKVKVGTFNDYEQRSYDFIELEKKLLRWEN